ncbi:MAG TPA: hypothetical protein VMF58_10420 [Rhizomicrobium sp.]|nr:hypothetical protein [Rhizomicrobium sp.]
MRTGVIPWILGAFLLFGTGAAQAADYYGPPSLERILPQIRSRHPGKFYDAEGPYRGPDGQYRYRLKWMTPNGRVVWFDADARTGRVLGPDTEMRGGPVLREERPRDYFEDDRRFNRGGRWPREDRPRGHRR